MYLLPVGKVLQIFSCVDTQFLYPASLLVKFPKMKSQGVFCKTTQPIPPSKKSKKAVPLPLAVGVKSFLHKKNYLQKPGFSLGLRLT
jgi:hypothetical protein